MRNTPKHMSLTDFGVWQMEGVSSLITLSSLSGIDDAFLFPVQ
jgi:hypothetical protein